MRDASIGVLSRVPAQVLPAVPMADARRSDLYGDRARSHRLCRLRPSLNKTDGRKAAQEKGREVTQTDEDAHEAASGVGDDAVK